MNSALTLFLFLINLLTVSENCTITGKVTDQKGEPVIFANVVIYQNGILVNGAETDIEGSYLISNLKAGIYEVEASYVGYTAQRHAGLIVKEGTNVVNFILSDDTTLLELGIEIKGYKVPLVMSDCTSSGTITADKIRKLPTKSISDIAASSAGVFSSDGSEISVRGSRSDETVYFLDGVRVTSSSNLHSEKSMESDRVGKITAGEWNDLNNWEKWSDLLVKDEFKNMNNYWTIHTSHRYPVFITNTSHYPISGVSVFLKNDHGNIVWAAVTDKQGHAELFDTSFSKVIKSPFLEYKYGNLSGKMKINRRRQDSTHIILDKKCQPIMKANISFVVDATGSMSDEIEFLKSDLSSVIESIEASNSDIKINYSSVFYRDINDQYVTKACDFTSEKEKLISFIDAQYASGGGDFPEAVDSALIHCMNLSWDEAADTKLVFLILDAPPHKEKIEYYKNVISQASSKGIKIIPISGSGIDRETEFLLKFTSILTNGTYIFITNDSGIGNDHIDPVHDEYQVESLHDLLIRVVNGYLYSRPCDSDTQVKSNIMEIYPNPVSDVIYITAKDSIPLRIELLSATGLLLDQVIKPENSKVKINIQDLVPGQYFIRCFYDNQTLTNSFIKI